MKAFSALKHDEEAKREAAWDPRARWQSLVEAIAWAEAQQPVQRNSPMFCLAVQKRHVHQ